MSFEEEEEEEITEEEEELKQLTYSCKVAGKKTGSARLSWVFLLMHLEHAVPINHTIICKQLFLFECHYTPLKAVFEYIC